MAKHHEFELRIVEVKGSLPVQKMRKLVPPVLPPSRPTPAEALEGMRAMKGAAAAIQAIPALQDITNWREVGFWGVCESTGAAVLHDGPLFWNHDDPGTGNLQFYALNCLVLFWGNEDLFEPPGPTITPPQNQDGQVWCDMFVQDGGYYLFAAHVLSNLEPPDYTSLIEFGIDDVSLGQVTLSSGAGGPPNYFFLLWLSPGYHRFLVKQVNGIFYFRSVTAWFFPLSQTNG